MKFTVSSTTLSKAVDAARAVVKNRSEAPFCNLLLSLEGPMLSVTGSDSTIEVTKSLNVDAERDGKAMIDAERLSMALKAFPSMPLVFDIENGTCAMSWNGGTSSMPAFDGADYMRMICDTSGNEISISAQTFIDGLENTYFCVSTDEFKTILHGVHVKISHGLIAFAATDTCKMSERTTEAGDMDAEFIVPSRMTSILLKTAADSKTSVSIRPSGQNITVRLGDTEIVCRSNEGVYPDYKAVIDRAFANTASFGVDARLLSGAIKRCSAFADDFHHTTRLQCGNGNIKIISEDNGRASSAAETIPCDNMQGSWSEVCLNSKYLLEILSKFTTDATVEVKLQDNAHPVLIAPPNDGVYRDIFLLMPLML